MKLNSISGVTYFVKDLKKSADFYEKLGFRMGKGDDSHLICYVNWFWVDLVANSGKAKGGDGAALYIKVDSAQAAHDDIKAMGFKPQGEPEKKPSGNTEFTVKDPDGYELVFFEKK